MLLLKKMRGLDLDDLKQTAFVLVSDEDLAKITHIITHSVTEFEDEEGALKPKDELSLWAQN